MSKCSAEEMFAVIANAREIIRNQPEASVFSLTDVTDAWFDPEVNDAMKEFLSGNKPYVVAAAVVGVTGRVMKLFGRRLVSCQRYSVISKESSRLRNLRFLPVVEMTILD